MKKESTIMSLLISGSRSPSDSTDVYIWLLIDELINLWKNGVRTYDNSTRKLFTQQAAVTWTINDFLTYDMLSDWSTKDYMALPYMQCIHLVLLARKECMLLGPSKMAPLGPRVA